MLILLYRTLHHISKLHVMEMTDGRSDVHSLTMVLVREKPIMTPPASEKDFEWVDSSENNATLIEKLPIRPKSG